MKVNVWWIAWCCIHSKIMPELDILAYVLLSLLVFEHGFIQICFGMFEFFTNIFSIIDEKHTQWMLDTKVKVFQESISCFMKWPWNCVSWNALTEKFHSVSFPLEVS